MPATISSKQFDLGQFKAVVVAVGILVSGIVGVGALAATDTVTIPAVGRSQVVVTRPLAHTTIHQGEGLVGPTSRTAQSALTAQYHANGGEGLVGPTSRTAQSAPMAYYHANGGEGLVGPQRDRTRSVK